MRIKMQYILIFVLASPLYSLAQNEITFEAEGARTPDPAYRMSAPPRVIDTTIKATTVDYPLLSLKHKTDAEIDQINPATIKIKDKLSQLYNTYVRLGVSTEFMPFGEIYFDAKRSRKYVYGAHVKHLSSFGDIKGYAPAQFDRTRGLIYGGINQSRWDLMGELHYNNQGLHYYGISDTLGLEADSISQRYSDFGFNADFGWHKKDSAKLNFNGGIVYNNFGSKKPFDDNLRDWRARENYFAINTDGWYKQGKHTFASDFNIRYNGYRYGTYGDTLTAIDTSLFLNNTVINIKPTITSRLKDNRFKAKVGMDLTFDFHNKNKVYIFPIAELKYSMFNDIFIPYIGLNGGLKQNTFKGLTRENEFIIPNINMLNESNIELYGGIKGTLSRRISFNAGASFGRVRNKALFIQDTTYSIGNKFTAIFDTMTVATIEGSMSYQHSEKLKIDGIGRFYSYDLLNNSFAWNLPRLQFILRGSYNLYDKFLFNLDLNIEEGRHALRYADEEGTFVENGQVIKNLGFIADANFGVEYRYNKRISAFVQLNNFASQRYMRWYNTPVQAFQALGGITFRF